MSVMENRTINDLLAYHDLVPEQPFLLETVVVKEPSFAAQMWRARISPDSRCECARCLERKEGHRFAG